MNPQAGFLLALAPHYHLPVTWAERVTVRSAPGEPWRAAGQEELSALVAPDATTTGERAKCLCLLGIPQHLQAACWQVIDRAEQAGAADLPGFDAFAEEVQRFLTFKQTSLPMEARFELLIQTRGAAPLDTGGPTAEGLWAAINPGDEPTAVIVSEPSCPLLVRLRVDPGEGLHLPAGDLRIRIDPPEQDEPRLLLLIKEAVNPAP